MSGLNKTPEKHLLLFSGRAHPKLANDVAAQLGISLVPTSAYDFANGEIYVRYEESVRGSDAFVSQSHTAIPAANVAGIGDPPDIPGPPRNGSATAITVVKTAPISTINMTGFRHICRGSSFVKAPGTAARREAKLNAELFLVGCFAVEYSSGVCDAEVGTVVVDMITRVLLRGGPV